MYRIRFHGRGGQGIKTAGRMLGSAFFLAGWQVQDAPLYGAERRGAPVYAYVRAARGPIFERGIIRRADLVVAADEGLIGVPAAGVLQGVDGHSVLLVLGVTPATEWQSRLNFPGRVLALPTGEGLPGPLCVGAAARLTGVIDADTLARAVRQELAGHAEGLVRRNLEAALDAYSRFADMAGLVQEGGVASAAGSARPHWIDLPTEAAAIAAPAIHRPLTSLQVRTGQWRTFRPVIDYARCNRCWWVCSEFCPDGAISVDADGSPRIDYEHCKGCLVCVAQCPPHAIAALPEHGEAAA